MIIHESEVPQEFWDDLSDFIYTKEIMNFSCGEYIHKETNGTLSLDYDARDEYGGYSSIFLWKPLEVIDENLL